MGFWRELYAAMRGKLGTPWKLWFMKYLINWSVALLRPLVPTHQRAGYSTAMWHFTMQQLVDVAEMELEHGQDRRRDRNFIDLLQFLQESVSYISTKDPFYNLWLSYFFRRAAITWKDTAHDYKQLLTDNYRTLPDEQFLQLTEPEFLDRAFNLKTCGGLYQLEDLMKNGEQAHN